MADELSTRDVLENDREVQSCKESSPQQISFLKQIKNLLSNICYPYSRDYDGLDQSLYLTFYLNAIVLIFIILFITKELSLGKDNGVTSHFVQERYVDILLISYMTPAILWTVCLFLIKNDTHVLVFDNNSVSYKRPLFYSIYVLGGGFFLTDILQVTFHLRCGIADSVRSLYLCVEAIFVLTQLLFQIFFLSASFLAKSSAKLAVIHMIGSNISVFIHGIFRKSSQEMEGLNHTMSKDHSIPSYCDQTQNALSKIMDVFQPLNLEFIVITSITLTYIFNNIKESQNEIQRYSPTTKMLRCRQNISTDTTLDKSGSGCNSGSSILLRNRNTTPSVDVGLLAGLFLALLLLTVGQLRTKSGNLSELITAHDICHVIIVSVMLCVNWLIAWVLYYYHPFYDWTPFTPVEGILFVATIGFYAWSTFDIVLVHLTNGASLSFILKNISRLLLGFIQTFVISKAMGYSLCCHGNYSWRKYFAQGLTFLVVCNAAVALNEIFFTTTKATEFETMFSKRTWTVLTLLTHSLEVLYFFYSSICFLDISFKYQQETVV